jgi:cysteine desulfurase/selenocysteine lyase
MVDVLPWMTGLPADASVPATLPVDVDPSFLPVPHGLEAGTPPIAEAVGLAAACDYLDSVLPYRHAGSGGGISSNSDSASEHPARLHEAAVNHALSMKAISAHVAELGAYMYDELRSSVKDIKIHGPPNRAENSDDCPRDSGIVSFHVPGIHSLDLATRLASPSAVRGRGLHEQHEGPSSSSSSGAPRRSVSVRSGLHCASLLHRALHCPDGGSVRASVYIYNDKSEVDYFVNAVNRAVHELQAK